MRSHSYIFIKNQLRNKHIYDIKVNIYNSNNLYDNYVQLIIYLKELVLGEKYTTLYNTYSLSFYFNGNYYNTTTFLGLQTLDNKIYDYHILLNKTIKSILRIFTTRYRYINCYYIIETTDGMKFKICSYEILLNYNIIKIKTLVDNPLIPNS